MTREQKSLKTSLINFMLHAELHKLELWYKDWCRKQELDRQYDHVLELCDNCITDMQK